MPSIGEFFELLYLRLKVALYNFKEERWVRRTFYHDPAFKKLDQALLSSSNPYHIPKAFPYGETPLSTLKQMADRWHIKASDYVLELGCGRGRAVFFLAHYTKATVKGIDWTPEFMSFAKVLAAQFPHLPVSFCCEDMHKTDLSSATIIYLYGTCLSEPSAKALGQRFCNLRPSTKIITVSEPLPQLAVQDQFVGSFPWGKTDVYLQIVSSGRS